MLFTVEIQAGKSGSWPALAPTEMVAGPAGVTAIEIAFDAAVNQNLVDGADGWRVCVWKGGDADTHASPAAIVKAEDVA